MDICTPTSCANGGTCVNVNQTSSCLCLAGFTGAACDVGELTRKHSLRILYEYCHVLHSLTTEMC